MAHSACAPVRGDTQRSDGYVRRRPEASVLYQVVAKHWPQLLEELEAVGGLPRFVKQEFEEYLRCGILEQGCLYLVCRHCGASQVVALSCKKRGFCPACLGRRMADTAVHLERFVLPAVPVRHWICSLPWGLRALLGYDRKLCAGVVGAFVGELSRSLCARAKRAFGLHSVAAAHTGAVAAIQRTDSALRLNVHAHVLALDGVYVRDEKTDVLVFHPLPTPTGAEVADVARRTAERIEKLLRADGRSLDPEMQDAEPLEPELCQNEPGLAACYTAAARGAPIKAEQPTLRLVLSRDPREATAADAPEADEPVAEVRGVNVHAKQLVDGRDRRQLERLCRYITRPPFSQDRLELRPDGRVELTLKRVWRDGTRTVVYEPADFLTRLIAAIPPPKFHLLRYFGVLSSHAAVRAVVVPLPPDDPTLRRPPPAAGDQLELELEARDDSPPPRKRWAWLLRHVFRADLDTCPECGGPMRWLEAAATRTASARLLAKLGLLPQPPPAPCFDPPGQLPLPFR